MGPAALPARALQHRGDGALEALVAVADHQLHASQTTCDERSQEAQPEGTIFTRTHVHTQHLTLTGGRVESDCDDHRHVYYAVVLPHFQKGGVYPNVGVGPIELTGAEALHFGIQLFTQAADLALRDAV
jgi:hypothetical protein